MIRWDAPGPYVVAFTTREGGVSSGPFDSLNLGSRDDEPTRVAANRALACEELGLDPERLAANRQRHTARAVMARAGVRTEPADALWTTEPGLPMLAMSADCVPIAIAATGGTPALAVVHAGWRGLAGGVVASAVAAVGAAATPAAIVGPSIGPCCYEVGPEVSERFDADLCVGRMLDLWTAAERLLRQSGVVAVERVDLCTYCHPELFFSYRRTGAPHGAQGVLGAVSG
jgi:YfiH family protein